MGTPDGGSGGLAPQLGLGLGDINSSEKYFEIRFWFKNHMSFLTLDAFSEDFNPTALEALLMGLKNPMSATSQSWD